MSERSARTIFSIYGSYYALNRTYCPAMEIKPTRSEVMNQHTDYYQDKDITVTSDPSVIDIWLEELNHYSIIGFDIEAYQGIVNSI